MLPALGLDYGKSKVGVALSVGPLAEPLCEIATPNLLNVLPRLVAEHYVHTLVIGLPQGPVKIEIENTVKSIRQIPKLAGLKVTFQDETLSTHDAVNALQHVSPLQRKKREHMAAAAIILQTWLDSRSTKL